MALLFRPQISTQSSLELMLLMHLPTLMAGGVANSNSTGSLVEVLAILAGEDYIVNAGTLFKTQTVLKNWWSHT